MIRNSVYTCKECGKNFPTPSKLRRHSLIHSGERPFACDLCQKGFTQQAHLAYHKRTYHTPSMVEKMDVLQEEHTVCFNQF